MKPRSPILITIILAVALIVGVFYAFTQNFNFLFTPIFLGTTIIATILILINNSLSKLIDAERFTKLSEEDKKIYLELLDTPYYKRVWNSAFKPSLQEEAGEIAVLDHGYDGIVELDNQLPKWWLGLFYFGIIYAVIYITAVSFTDFADSATEYEEEFIQQKKEVEEYMKTAPQATLENAVFSEDHVAAGKEIFNSICVTCHGMDGIGGTGPDLTDDYWINIYQTNLYKNIFYMISVGSKHDPTMRSFLNTGELTGNNIRDVASYVYKINTTAEKPNGIKGGKSPQGIIAPWSKFYTKGAGEGSPGDGVDASSDFKLQEGFYLNNE